MKSIQELTPSDFEDEALYDEILDEKDEFKRKLLVEKFSSIAKAIGVSFSFKNVFHHKEKALEPKKTFVAVMDGEGKTEFTDQPVELICAGWRCTDLGVYGKDNRGAECCACSHPIMITKRYTNIDSQTEKYRLAWSRGVFGWRELIVESRTLASSQSIIELATVGVSVTSENARALVKYLQDLITFNYNELAAGDCVDRLGWISAGMFSPYAKGLDFDGDAAFKAVFDSIHERGDFETWRSAICEEAQKSIYVKIVIDAACASALLRKVNMLPFFLHLWSSESGTGKTVALMAAASVWGDPEPGRYMQTFNSTRVGHEKLAGFLNSLPMLIDELQLAKDAHGRLNFDVYGLAEGVGKTRGNKLGGIERTPTWRNCIITTGESPITSQSAGAGAKNRVLEIEISPGEKAVTDGHALSATLRQNYGFLGKRLVDWLQKNKLEAVTIEKKGFKYDGLTDFYSDQYDSWFKSLSRSDTTDKQALAGAALLLADNILQEDDLLGSDWTPLDEDDFKAFLQKSADVDVNARAYEYIQGWVASNERLFVEKYDGEQGYQTLRTLGAIEDGYAYIIKTEFEKMMDESGFNARSFLSWAKTRGLLKLRASEKGFGFPKKIGGLTIDCITVKVPDGSTE